MKFFILLILIIPCTTDAQTKSNNAKGFYDLIKKQFKIIDSARNNPDINLDSFDIEKESNKIFSIIEENKEIVFALPDTLDFDLLYIAKSADRKFCLVSWDTRLGGSEIDYASVALYKFNNRVLYQKQVEYDNDNAEMNPQYYYTSIYSVQSKTNEIYLARGFGQGSTALPWQELRAFEIKNNKLLHPKIFPDNESHLGVEFDTHAFKNDEKIPTIKLKDKSKTILIPIANSDEGLTGKYFTLKFNGAKFYKVSQ